MHMKYYLMELIMLLSHGKEDYIKVIAQTLAENEFAGLKPIAEFMNSKSSCGFRYG